MIQTKTTSKNLGLTAFLAITAILVTNIRAETCAECKRTYDSQQKKDCRNATIYASCVDAKTCRNETAKQMAYQEKEWVCATGCDRCAVTFKYANPKDCKNATIYASCVDEKTCTNETAKQIAYEEKDRICTSECNRCASTFSYAKPKDCKAAEAYVSCTNQSCNEARDKDVALNAKQTYCQSPNGPQTFNQTQPPKGDDPKESPPPPKTELQDGQTMPPTSENEPLMGQSPSPGGEGKLPKEQTTLPKEENVPSQHPGDHNQQKSTTTPGDMPVGTTNKCSMCKHAYTTGEQNCKSATTYSECTKASCTGDQAGEATTAANIKNDFCACEACKNSYDNSQKLCNDAKTYSGCACSEDEKRTARTQVGNTCSSECTVCSNSYEQRDKNCESAKTYVNCSQENCPKEKTDMAIKERDQLCKEQGVEGKTKPTTTMKNSSDKQDRAEGKDGDGNKSPTTTMNNSSDKQDRAEGDGGKSPTTTMNSKDAEQAAGAPATARQTEEKDSCPRLDTCVATFIQTIRNGFAYTDSVCRNIRIAMKCFHGITSGNCPSYDPYSSIGYTFTDLLLLFEHYCTDSQRAKTSCTKFDTCFSTIKTPQDINAYLDAKYWCAVLDSTMKCGMENTNETNCGQLTPTTDGLSKIQQYCSDAFDVRNGQYYNGVNTVTSSVLAFVLALMAVIKNWI